jgi:hypothetical protein
MILARRHFERNGHRANHRVCVLDHRHQHRPELGAQASRVLRPPPGGRRRLVGDPGQLAGALHIGLELVALFLENRNERDAALAE